VTVEVKLSSRGCGGEVVEPCPWVAGRRAEPVEARLVEPWL
jgi:hypothetical protein